MREESVIKSYPIRVHQGLHSPQRVSQLVRIIEVKSESFHFVAERIRTVKRIRQRDHLVTRFKQSLGDVAAQYPNAPVTAMRMVVYVERGTEPCRATGVRQNPRRSPGIGSREWLDCLFTVNCLSAGAR